MTTFTWHGRNYSVNNLGGEFGIQVTAGNVMEFAADAEDAIKWLSCRSLRKGKARELVEQEMKGGK